MEHHSRHELGALGPIILTALAIAALTASVAQAEIKPALYLRESGTLLTEKETVAGGVEGTGTFSIPAKNTEINCAKGTESAGVIENRGKVEGVGTGTFTFSECTVLNFKTKEELKACTTEFNAHNEKGNLKIATEKTSILLHAVGEEGLAHRVWLNIHPPKGSTFTTLEFGGTCSLPEKVEVTGSFAVEVPNEDAVKLKTIIDTESEAGKKLQELAEAKLSFGASPAYIKAKAFVELTGAHAGAPWGIM
jgi:hypothetical protein